jgi:large subunit ribosomal protein L9
MKVLLIQDVDNLGYAGDVKSVANGFGRNYLLPQNLAVLATPGAMKQAETIRKTAETRRAKETEDARAIANQLIDLELIFERRAGETGKLYGSVTSGDIADAIMEKTEIEIDKRKVSLAEPVRNLGAQDVTIKLMIDVTTQIKVEVVPLGGMLERERLSVEEAAALGVDLEPAEESAVEAAASEAVETKIVETAEIIETAETVETTEIAEIEAAAPVAGEDDVADTAETVETTEIAEIEAAAPAAGEDDVADTAEDESSDEAEVSEAEDNPDDDKAD